MKFGQRGYDTTYYFIKISHATNGLSKTWFQATEHSENSCNTSLTNFENIDDFDSSKHGFDSYYPDHLYKHIYTCYNNQTL